MSSYIESSRLSYEDDSLSMSISENQDSLAQSSMAADSMIASTDIGDSSMINSTMTDMNYNSTERLRKASAERGGPRFYHKKRFWAMCLAITVVLSAIFIPLLFLVIIPAVAQDTINKSKIDIEVINITKATNDSFSMSMLGGTSGAGRLGARIDFNGPVQVIYNGNEIGSVQMSSVSVSNGQGVVHGSDQIFNIKKKDVFTGFASATLKEKSFTWTLRGSANVRTLGMSINNLKLLKDIVIPGSNGFASTLVSLNVTQNTDSLTLEIHTTIDNPSPIAIELGDMNLQLIYNGTVIADVLAKGVFFHKDINDMTLIGKSSFPTTEADKFNYLKVMNAYLTNTPINTTAKVINVISPRGDMVDWVNDAAKSLDLQTTVGNQPNAPQFISKIDFGEMSLKFTPDAPYSPTISSTNATADFQLPFHIDYQILSAGQSVTLFSSQGKPVASIDIPETNVTTTSTGISLNIPETQMKVVDNDAFSDFLVGFTSTSGSNIDIAGTTNVRVKTFLGDDIPIDGIPFKLSTFLQGFNQFNSDSGSAPVLSNLTFHSDPASPTQLQISVDVSINNPARYSFSGGSVSLDVIYQDSKIGAAVIPNLTIVPGPNSLPVIATFDVSGTGPGSTLISSFFTGHAITLSIRGNDNSTNIASLAKAFKAINITSTIPPIGQGIPKNAGPVVGSAVPATTPAS